MTPAPTDPAAPSSTGSRAAWAILIAVTLYVCYFSHLDVIGFVGPDEPRYAWIARDMAESGDWVTPRLYGKPWFEKPPLLYWGGAVFFKVLGEGHPEIAARLPSAISALLATLALAWLAWRTYGEECARWLLLFLPTSVGMIGFSHACATDMPFAGMLTVALVCAAVVLGLIPKNENAPVLPRTPWLALVLFGFFLGLAVLAKGPAGVILIGGAVFFWALFTKRWSDALRLLHPVAIATFCITALPWYILCARRNPDFFRIFIIEHNFKRYLTPEFQHIQPFWFYLPVLLVTFFPWSALLAALGLWSVARIRLRPRNGATTIFIFCWALLVTGFFSISKSKLPGYVLPAVPSIALLFSLGVCAMRERSQRLPEISMIVSGAVLTVISMLIRAMPDAFLTHLRVEPGIVAALLLPLGIACLLAGLAARSRRPVFGRILQVLSALAVALLVAASGAILNRYYLDAALSAKSIATLLKSDQILLDNLRTFGVRRSNAYTLSFYLHKEVPAWEDHPVRNGYVLTEGKYCDKLQTRDICEDLWGMRDFVSSGPSALLRITPRDSLPSPGDSRQPQQKE
jgi:4-amino-4-deoxy-L-arabinose transferase-like glycosyltransferase